MYFSIQCLQPWWWFLVRCCSASCSVTSPHLWPTLKFCECCSRRSSPLSSRTWRSNVCLSTYRTVSSTSSNTYGNEIGTRYGKFENLILLPKNGISYLKLSKKKLILLGKDCQVVLLAFIFRQNNNKNTKINKKDCYKVEGDLSIVVITSREKATQTFLDILIKISRQSLERDGLTYITYFVFHLSHQTGALATMPSSAIFRRVWTPSCAWNWPVTLWKMSLTSKIVNSHSSGRDKHKHSANLLF